MKVYRIEDADGVGPFRGNHAKWYDHAAHRCLGYHSAFNPPGPYDENETIRCGFRSGVHVFGFRSKRQLAQWFRSVTGRKAMKGKGATLKVYEVYKDDVLIGDWQVAFVRDRAVQVCTLDLATLR